MKHHISVVSIGFSVASDLQSKVKKNTEIITIENLENLDPILSDTSVYKLPKQSKRNKKGKLRKDWQ